jgi:hypothetical protein
MKSLTPMLLFTLLFSSCGLLKKPNPEVEQLQPSLSDEWQHISSSYQCGIQFGGNEYSGTLRLKMKRDSIIWFSIKAVFGLQIARGVINQDSAHILNVMQGEYYALSLEELERRMQLPAQVSSIQKLFTGETLTNELVKIPGSKDSTFWGKSEPFKDYSTSISNTGVVFNSFIKKNPDRSLVAQYQSFTKWKVYPIAAKWFIQVKDELNTVRLEMQLRNVSFSTIPSYPFSIPEGYKRVKLL